MIHLSILIVVLPLFCIWSAVYLWKYITDGRQ